MKRLILTSLIAAGAVMAQTSAPATPAASGTQKPATTQKSTVKRHKKTKKSATPSTAQAPVSKAATKSSK